MVVISNITRQVLDNVLIEVKKDENMAKIRENIIDPIIHYSIERIYPYIIVTGAVFILTLLIAITILIILIKKM
jgi:hypothetical protein